MFTSIAILGRPNVGKSTLFNKLTNTRDAIVSDFSGLTKDRNYGYLKIGNIWGLRGVISVNHLSWCLFLEKQKEKKE